MRNNPVKDFSNLLWLEIIMIKNIIKDSIHNPLTFFKSIIAYIFPFLFIFWSSFQRTSRNDSNFKVYNISSKVDIAGAVIVALILLIVLWKLYSSVEKYNPSQFTVSDANYLFPSPISPRTIYVFTMFRNSFKTIFILIITCVIYWYIIIRSFSANSSKMIFVIIAFFLTGILLQCISYLVYFLSIKFKIGKGIKYFVKGFIVVMATYIVFNTVTSSNLLQGFLKTLNGKVIENIPVIGWVKVMILYPFSGVSMPSFQGVALLITTIAVLGFTVFMADDYYEEALQSAEHIHKIIVEAKERRGNSDSLNTENNKKKKKTRINVVVKGEFKGPWAFFWKEMIVIKRKGKNVFISPFKIFLLISFFVISYLVRKGKADSIMGMYAAMFIGIITIIPTMLSPLNNERRSSYLYLLPGKARDKILAIHSISFINTIIYCGIITFPMLVFTVNMKFFQVFSIFIVLTTTVFVILLGVLVFTLIMPSYDDGKNGIFIYFLEIFMFIPSIIIAVITGFFISEQTYAIFIAFALGSICTIIILIVLSDWLFSKMELKG